MTARISTIVQMQEFCRCAKNEHSIEKLTYRNVQPQTENNLSPQAILIAIHTSGSQAMHIAFGTGG